MKVLLSHSGASAPARLLHWVDFGLFFGSAGNEVSFIQKQYFGRFAYLPNPNP